MRKPEDFYKSQELFSKWRQGIYKNAQCAYQLYGEHVLVEKWMVSGPGEIHAIMVEIFPDGDGFFLYNWTNIKDVYEPLRRSNVR